MVFLGTGLRDLVNLVFTCKRRAVNDRASITTLPYIALPTAYVVGYLTLMNPEAT